MRTSARVLALLLASLPASGAGEPVDFERLSVAQGLSQSIIDRILQDRRGFLWFATEDGLNRWDGHRFTVFRNVAGEPRSLSYNDLKCVYEDREGVLWVGTFEGGLNRYDPRSVVRIDLAVGRRDHLSRLFVPLNGCWDPKGPYHVRQQSQHLR